MQLQHTLRSRSDPSEGRSLPCDSSQKQFSSIFICPASEIIHNKHSAKVSRTTKAVGVHQMSLKESSSWKQGMPPHTDFDCPVPSDCPCPSLLFVNPFRRSMTKAQTQGCPGSCLFRNVLSECTAAKAISCEI